MILNRFCIDEDAAFEVSGVHSLKKSEIFLEILDFFVSGVKKCQKISMIKVYQNV